MQYPLDYYPPFASGCGFVLSRDLVQALIKQPLPDYRLLVRRCCGGCLEMHAGVGGAILCMLSAQSFLTSVGDLPASLASHIAYLGQHSAVSSHLTLLGWLHDAAA